jgi:S-formylglutathione hydrolase FrmB
VNPLRPIPPPATVVHGLTDADVAACSPFADIAPALLAFLDGADLAGFNLPFDLLFLTAEFERAGPAKPARLDVVLHGSSKPTGLSELGFVNRFDEGNGWAKAAPDANFIELHPLGRVENGYRWAGETDVFEAIEAACRRYKIDRDRVVLRGMSTGASGTWHLRLKHPDRFVALGPYRGYVDTHEFSNTPLASFVKVGPLPPHQEKALHMLDSVDYAANAGVVPAVACMGEKDVFFQAHVLMGKAMAREGLQMVNLISPGTGHAIDPKTHAEQMRRIKTFADRGADRAPSTSDSSPGRSSTASATGCASSGSANTTRGRNSTRPSPRTARWT